MNREEKDILIEQYYRKTYAFVKRQMYKRLPADLVEDGTQIYYLLMCSKIRKKCTTKKQVEDMTKRKGYLWLTVREAAREVRMKYRRRIVFSTTPISVKKKASRSAHNMIIAD